MKKRCYVYWIHLPEQTDITSEGYVGIAFDFKKRFREHKSYAKRGEPYVIHNAIRKYGDNLIYKVVLEGSQEYCREIESKLRPSSYIGWNMAIGGQESVMTGRKHSESTRQKMRNSAKSKTPELRAYQSSFLSRGIPVKPWELKSAKKSLWLIADEIYEVLKNNPSFGSVKIRTYLGLDKILNLQNIFKRIKDQNWNPSQDPEWVEWTETFYKEKEINYVN